MGKITVVGSFVMDCVAEMKEFPAAGQTVLGKSVAFYPGGKGINQCVAIARLGGQVSMAGMLGNDAYGACFREILDKDNICAEGVFSCDVPTAMAQVQINASGQNRICVIPSANYMFDFEHVDKIENLIKASDLLVLQLELRLDVTKELIFRAEKFGVTVLLNPAPAVNLPDELIRKIAYITPNETELALLTGMKTETEAELRSASESLLRRGVGCVVATLGNRGAMIADKDGTRIISGFKVKSVDTVAAGDSFNGALAVALCEGRTIDDSVCFANAMGALTVQNKGAIPSIKYRTDVEKFIEEHCRNT